MTNTDRLQKIVEQHGMQIDGYHGGAGQFRDIYIGTGADYGRLRELRDALIAARFVDVKVTHVDNPDHNQHDKAMVEVSSFWWDEPPILPNRLVRHTPTGKILETMSYPHGELLDKIQARSPGDPTTMETYRLRELVEVKVKCERDGTEFTAVVTGEFKNCHIDCHICCRGYYAEHTADGTFTQFVSDRPLTILS
jgi:hypothetical protein